MFSWRITKYNPFIRDADGIYPKDEWTSISDIGKLFEGSKFTYEEYEKVEKYYISFVLKIMDYFSVNNLRISSLEKNVEKLDEKYTSKNLESIFDHIADNKTYFITDIELVLKLILREDIWCKLISNNQFEFHFGYDFYMYLVSVNNINDFLSHLGTDLYIEEFKSPYLD